MQWHANSVSPPLGKQTERGADQRGPNTVRTLCVRTCDGYYFPISFSTTRKYFEADEAACQRMCPAGDASLYYHSRREGPEQMVSIAGAPYTDLENAFRYRTVLDRSCTCGTPLPISEPAEIVLAGYSDEPSVSLEDSRSLASLARRTSFHRLSGCDLVGSLQSRRVPQFRSLSG